MGVHFRLSREHTYSYLAHRKINCGAKPVQSKRERLLVPKEENNNMPETKEQKNERVAKERKERAEIATKTFFGKLAHSLSQDDDKSLNEHVIEAGLFSGVSVVLTKAEQEERKKKNEMKRKLSFQKILHNKKIYL